MARDREVDVILDAAHSVGQVEIKLNALGCDFIGVNLHKWVGAPIGCGVIYIKKDRINAIDPYMGKSADVSDINGRIGFASKDPKVPPFIHTGLQPGVSLAINPETVSTVSLNGGRRNLHVINGLSVVTRR